MQNSTKIVTQSLSRYNVDLFYRFLYYHVLCSKFFYYSSLLLLLKKQSTINFKRAANFKTHHVYTILRSPFIHKKSREQFEYRLHKSNFVVGSKFNQFYCFSPFGGNWLLLLRTFRGNHIQLKSVNHYLLG